VQVTLVAVKADGQQHDVPMKRARLMIGRKKEADLRIPVPSVSREHCEVRVESGKVHIRDLGSSNGTYVDGERVQEGELPAGATLGVGPAVFVVRINGEPAQIDAKKAFSGGKAPEPVAAAAGPTERPSKPAGSKSSPAPKSGPDAKTRTGDDDDLDVGNLDESSVSDFDFNLLDDDDEKKQPRL
jgi:predicted component of type VI protein secretion system